MIKTVTIFEDVSIKEIPYVGQADVDFYETINRSSDHFNPYVDVTSTPIKKLIECSIDPQTYKDNEIAFNKFDTYYYAYSPNVEKLLKMYFGEFNTITDKLYRDMYKEQVKSQYLENRIEMVNSISFWKRLKFLFNPKSLKV